MHWPRMKYHQKFWTVPQHLKNSGRRRTNNISSFYFVSIREIKNPFDATGCFLNPPKNIKPQQKTSGSLMFSGGTKRDESHEMGERNIQLRHCKGIQMLMLYSRIFMWNGNNILANGNFPDQLKWPDVKLIYKIYYRTNKEIHVSILPHISKICDRCLFSQFNNYKTFWGTTKKCENKNLS